MPALKNLKRETFCQMIFEGTRFGWTQGVCYSKAGYRSTGHAAETCGSRLLKNADIQARLAELGAPAVKKTRATIDTLIEQLDQVFNGATEDKQHGAAGSAVTTKAKLLGYLRDRVEIGGVGEFDGCETPEQVVDKILVGQDAADVLAGLNRLRELIELRAAHQATVIEASELAPRRSGEGALALGLLRPAGDKAGR